MPGASLPLLWRSLLAAAILAGAVALGGACGGDPPAPTLDSRLSRLRDAGADTLPRDAPVTRPDGGRRGDARPAAPDAKLRPDRPRP